MLWGRFNADIFAFADGYGEDTIGDFATTSALEQIDLRNVTAITDLSDLQLSSSTQGAAQQSGADVVIDTGGGARITLPGVKLSDLHASVFLF